MRVLPILAALVLLAPLQPTPALAKFPEGELSAAGAVYDSLCTGNASDPLVVEVVAHDAFDSPVVSWPASDITVRRADGLGPSVAADRGTDVHGYTTITTTVGLFVDSGCCDSLEVIVSGFLTMTVRRLAAPIGTVPDCAGSAVTVQHGDICPGFASNPVVVDVTLWNILDLPITGVPPESVTVRCVDAGPGDEIPADAPTDTNGHTTITTTVSDLIDVACCDTLEVMAHQISSCVCRFLVSFGPYDGPFPAADISNPDPEPDDRFGEVMVPFQGDFLIGATADDGVHGSVTRVDGDTGAPLFVIPAPKVANRRFGSALSDAGGRILASDPDYREVYLFDADGHLLFSIPDPEPDNDFFGNALAYVPGTIFVAASADSVNHLWGAGTVYAFDSATGAYRFEIPDPTPGTGDAFGACLRARGNDLLIGASGDNSLTGAVYLYRADGTPLSFMPGPPGPHLQFGVRVNTFGDDIVVGCGWGMQLYVLDGTSGDVLRTIPMHEDLRFGSVVTTSRYVIFGLPFEDNVIAPDAGYVYVHDGSTGELVARIRNPLPTWNDWFGWGIAATDTRLVIAAPGRNSRTGVAFLYSNGATDAPLTSASPSPQFHVAPNPFRGSTRVEFWLPREERVSLSVYDAAGRLVRRLRPDGRRLGRHEVEWDGLDGGGTPVAAGIYFVRLVGEGSDVRTGRVVRLR